MLGLGHDPALPAPTVERAPEEVGKAAGGSAPGQAISRGHGEVIGDGVDQALVARQAEDVVDTVGLAPDHQLLAGKAGLGPEQDLHPRPPGADLADDAGQFIPGAGGRIDVRPPELGGEEVPATEHG